jgi:hypothetical protein
MLRDKISRYCWRAFAVCFFAVWAVAEDVFWATRHVRRLAC